MARARERFRFVAISRVRFAAFKADSAVTTGIDQPCVTIDEDQPARGSSRLAAVKKTRSPLVRKPEGFGSRKVVCFTSLKIYFTFLKTCDSLMSWDCPEVGRHVGLLCSVSSLHSLPTTRPDC